MPQEHMGLPLCIAASPRPASTEWPKMADHATFECLDIFKRLLETRVARWEHLWGCPVWPSHMHGLCTAVFALFYMELDRLILP